MGNSPIRPVRIRKTQEGVSFSAKPKAVDAIRRRCLDDCAETQTFVRNCPFNGKREALCALYKYRMGRRATEGPRRGSRVKAIRAYCLWCCCGQMREVELCPATGCSLWPWRFGMSAATAEKHGKCTDVQRFLEAEEPKEA